MAKRNWKKDRRGQERKAASADRKKKLKANRVAREQMEDRAQRPSASQTEAAKKSLARLYNLPEDSEVFRIALPRLAQGRTAYRLLQHSWKRHLQYLSFAYQAYVGAVALGIDYLFETYAPLARMTRMARTDPLVIVLLAFIDYAEPGEEKPGPNKRWAWNRDAAAIHWLIHNGVNPDIESVLSYRDEYNEHGVDAWARSWRRLCRKQKKGARRSPATGASEGPVNSSSSSSDTSTVDASLDFLPEDSVDAPDSIATVVRPALEAYGESVRDRLTDKHCGIILVQRRGDDLCPLAWTKIKEFLRGNPEDHARWHRIELEAKKFTRAAHLPNKTVGRRKKSDALSDDDEWDSPE